MPRLNDGSVILPEDFEQDDAQNEPFTGQKLQAQFEDLAQVAQDNLDTLGRNDMRAPLDMAGFSILNSPTIADINSEITDLNNQLNADEIVNSMAISVTGSATADGVASIAMGEDSSADGANSIALGGKASVSGDFGVSLGYNASVSGDNDQIAIGSNASVVNQYNGIAMGDNAAVNFGTPGGAGDSMAIGTRASTTANISMAMGRDSSSNGVASMAIGLNASTSSSANDGIAMGTNASATATEAIAIGKTINSTANSARIRGNTLTLDRPAGGAYPVCLTDTSYDVTKTVGTTNVAFTGLVPNGVYTLIGNLSDTNTLLYINDVPFIEFDATTGGRQYTSSTFVAKGTSVNVRVSRSSSSVRIKGGF